MGEDPREQLAREARKLREEREAKTRSDAQAAASAKRAALREANSHSVWRVRTSVARIWTLMGVFMALFIAPMGMGEGETESSAEITLAIGLGLAGAFALYFASGLLRWRFWRRRLPFLVEHDERVLGMSEFVKIAHVTVTFRDVAVPDEQLAELLTARVPETKHHATSKREVRIESPELEVEGANWRVAGWFRKLVRRVLVDVHRAYPIELVTIDAAKTREFYVPSGD